MKRIGVDLGELDDKEPSPEISIRVTVPEEFAGVAVGAPQARQGYVTNMDVQSGIITISASLPASEHDSLSEEITYVTLRRGKVERANVSS